MRTTLIATMAWIGWMGGCRPSEPAIPDRPKVPGPPVTTAKPPSDVPVAPRRTTEPGPFRFVDVTGESGIGFRHVSGMTEERLFPTANGSGVAILDLDGDGRLDLLFATGNLLPLVSEPAASNHAYRNLGNGRFEDVTDRTGLGFRGYCHGFVVGDIDNDGDPDVYLCNYGPDRLFRNDGVRFTDISREAGVLLENNWSSAGAFLDYDRDGDLDLYVARYGDWRYPRDNRYCGDPQTQRRHYCSPKELTPVRHILWRNDGKGGFTDATEAAGLARSDGHGFGVVAADLDGNGLVDLCVANDQDPNFVFLNRGNGTFEDATMYSGAAFDAQGRTQSGMGIDAEDIDGDGRPEIFVTNFQGEPNTLYRNLGHGSFLDVTGLFGLAVDSIPWVGWGCAFADFDLDGWPDVVVANSHIDDNAVLQGRSVPHAEPPLLYRNREGRGFVLANRGAGPYFESDHVGRGLAYGDLDDDGDLDLVISHKDGPPALLRNDTPRSDNHWIRPELEGRRSGRDAVGARVEVRAGGRTLVRQRKGGTSLMSAHDPRLLIGIGTSKKVEAVIVRWPSGAVSEQSDLDADRTYHLIEPEPAR